MQKIKFIIVSTSAAAIVGCANSKQESLDHLRSPENRCMHSVFTKIKTVKNNTNEQANNSKENQCFWAAEQRAYWSSLRNSNRTPQSLQNAAGNIVIQQSINIKNDNPQAAKDAYYQECMKNPNVQDIIAPPAYVQLEGMTYGFNSISTESCPAPFAILMKNYVQGAQYGVDVMKKYPHLNTSQQNVILRKKIPSNDMEKEIIDASKPSVSAYVEMVRFFAQSTGWCPSDNGVFRCNPSNIPFR